MKRYVLCFPHQIPSAFQQHIMLIERNRPAWQKGLYNLVGGHIEEGEDPRDAAIRELWEESGIRAAYAEVAGKITGPDYEVFVVNLPYGGPQRIIPGLTDEPVFWLPVQKALAHPKLIPNLRVIVPLMFAGAKGWELIDRGILTRFECLLSADPAIVTYKAA